MKEIAVVSGKGGTGKTSITASLARLASPVVSADCDVDGANLALLLGGAVRRRGVLVAGEGAVVDEEACVECWACEEVCRFGAISMEAGPAVVDSSRCHGCHACALVCAARAIRFVPREVGQWLESETPSGPLIHAELGVGLEGSGKLATEVRRRAVEVARRRGLEMIIVDGPPGIGCPVHATLTGVAHALAVVEPTPSAEHDLERLAGVTSQFRVPLSVAINKHDLSADGTRRMEALAGRLGAPVLAKLPFDRKVPVAAAAGEPMIAVEGFAPTLAALFDRLKECAGVGDSLQAPPIPR